MDEMHPPKYVCNVFDRGHIMQLDMGSTTPSKTVFTCACGVSQEENEDAGTGA